MKTRSMSRTATSDIVVAAVKDHDNDYDNDSDYDDNTRLTKMTGVIAPKTTLEEDGVSVSTSSGSDSEGEDVTQKTADSSSCGSDSVGSDSVSVTTDSSSSVSSGSGSDSEGEDVIVTRDEVAFASSSSTISTTGLKRRRRGGGGGGATTTKTTSSNNVVTTDDVTVAVAVAVAVTVAVDDPNTSHTKSTGDTKADIKSDTNTKTDTTVNANKSNEHAYTFLRWVEFVIGCLIFFIPLPLVFVQIVCTTTWELLDQNTLNVCNFGTQMNIRFDSFLKKFTHHPKDGFIVTTTIWLGLVLPTYFFWEAYTQYQSIQAGLGFIWWRAAIYNIIRIGPQYRHFMFVYVLCHKEAHSYGKLFAEPYNTSLALKYIYNYFIGFFHGVLPGPFTESHIYNHHKYDNSVDDVYSTGAYPRDSFIEFLRYVYIWFLYALNISSILKFYKEQKMERVIRSVGGTIYYCVGVSIAYQCVGFQFATFYILYPMVEGNILLAAVNYTWHAFIDPNDHDNDYVNSVTILDGLNFTLSEEYHVVHHQYGGVHWSKNEELYLKHLDDYKKYTATVFEKTNLFVVWGMIVAKDYDALTEHFVQLEDDKSKHLSQKELANLLKVRLQCTTWKYN